MKNPYYQISIDESPENPREWDNLGTMVCWHSRYSLGDEQPKLSHIEWLEQLPELSDEQIASSTDATREHYVEALLERMERQYIVLPLYLYDHSGITMNTTGFSCGWDSGPVGYIYVSLKDVREEHGWQKVTAKRRKQIETNLTHEVDTYDTYLRGEVYEYRVYRNWGEEEADQCGGYFSREACEAEALSLMAWYSKEERCRHQKTLKAQLKHRVPLERRTEYSTKYKEAA